MNDHYRYCVLPFSAQQESSTKNATMNPSLNHLSSHSSHTENYWKHNEALLYPQA